MKRRPNIPGLFLLLTTLALLDTGRPLDAQVEIIKNDDAQIDIRINGEPFSSYHFEPLRAL